MKWKIASIIILTAFTVPEWLVCILATILILIDVVNTLIRLLTSQTGNSAIVSLMSSYVRSNGAKRDPGRSASATGFRPPLQYRSWRCRVTTDQSRRKERLHDSSSEPRKPIRKEAHIGLPHSPPSRRRPYIDIASTSLLLICLYNPETAFITETAIIALPNRFSISNLCSPLLSPRLNNKLKLYTKFERLWEPLLLLRNPLPS
jgi:hypothetical protein